MRIPPDPRRYRAFGFAWRSDIALDGFDPAPFADSDAAPIYVYRADRLADRGQGRAVDSGFLYADGIRFRWAEEVVFDIFASAIAYAPGRDWTGCMPASFYSTVAALLAAWRGLVPLHAGAVAVDGRAVLVAGPAGAGKSTLTAGLVDHGARFIADDLVVLSVAAGRITVAPGRPTIRLHPDTAREIDPAAVPVIGDPLGKWLARPRHRLGESIDLGAMLILGADADSAPAARLLPHLFRRRRMAALPMRDALVRDLLAIAMRAPILAYPVQTDNGVEARRARVARAIAEARRAMAHDIRA